VDNRLKPGHRQPTKADQREQQRTDPCPADLNQPNRFDQLLALIGSGRDLWANEHADEYVNRLREGWEVRLPQP
jgi:hypothetical protein